MAAHRLSYWLRPSARIVVFALIGACADGEEQQDTLDAAIAVADGAVPGPTPGLGTVPEGSAGSTGSNNTGGAGGGTGGSTGPGSGVGELRDSGITFPPFSRDAGPRDAAGAAVDSGSAVPLGDGGPDLYAEARQACVDTINMYRATRNLPALMRADATREACSDEGAQYDGDLNRGRPANQVQGHQSTSNRSARCRSVGFGSQNTCPNWSVGGRSGNATLIDAIKRCLAQMWAEGEPPVPVDQCKMDRAPGGCFMTHGHWINMTATNSTWVACGFYNVEGGTYWMNQEFDYRFR